MQLHSDIIKSIDIFEAANHAGVDVVKQELLGSRIRDRKWNVNLEGDSKRRPNQRGSYDGFAATWDQWGVFFGYLFHIDPAMVCGSGVKNAAYDGQADFNRKTDMRFEQRTLDCVCPTRYQFPAQHFSACPCYDALPGGHSFWPDDAHGDHVFRWNGTMSQCTKCSAKSIR